MDSQEFNRDRRSSENTTGRNAAGATEPSRATPFVLLFQGRTGSTYLIESLSRHPQVLAETEHLVGLRQKGGQAQLRWAQWFLNSAHDSKPSAVGFKTKLSDVLDREGFAKLLNNTAARILFGKRRNLVKMVVSWLRSEQLYHATGKWNLYSQQDQLGPLYIDIDKFQIRLDQVEHRRSVLERFVHDLDLPVLPVEYEELLVDPSRVLDQVLSFLNLSPQKLEGRSKKNTSDDLRQAVTNFNEMRSQFTGTKYEHMFDEVIEPPAT